jgi:hypothetical protein
MLTVEWLAAYNEWVDVTVSERGRPLKRRRGVAAVFEHVRRLSLDGDELPFPFILSVPGAGWRDLVGETVPTRAAIDLLGRLLRNKRCVSVGCGPALWEQLLRRGHGVDIVLVDLGLPVWRYDDADTRRLVFTVRRDHVPAAVHTADALLLIWPEPERLPSVRRGRARRKATVYGRDGYDHWCLSAFRGDTIVVIAERDDRPLGDIGSDLFWTAISDIAAWTATACITLPSYPPDRYFPVLRVYTRAAR